LADADRELGRHVTEELIRDVLGAVPEEWLEPTPRHPSAAAMRQAYLDYLLARLNGGRGWLPSAAAA
jgi:hypothetical protein